ncbi:MAG: PH domain-containing protein [Paludibacteraceae bacterium]|nr:PH domain-containing protein [Paludibacteraceae bacterium]
MGLLNGLLGNASEINTQALQEEFAPLLCDGEQIEVAYSLIRDKLIFTNKRLIAVDVQGVTGHKRCYSSFPYRSIVRFSVETSGTFDLDGELKIWVSGNVNPFVFEFSRKVDVKSLQRTLAGHVLM